MLMPLSTTPLYVSIGDQRIRIGPTKDHASLIVADKILSYNAINGVVEPSRVFGVEETWPYAENVVDVFFAETTVSFSGALVLVVIMAIWIPF